MDRCAAHPCRSGTPSTVFRRHIDGVGVAASLPCSAKTPLGVATSLWVNRGFLVSPISRQKQTHHLFVARWRTVARRPVRSQPVMEKHKLQDLPESIRGATRLSTMRPATRSGPRSPPSNVQKVRQKRPGTVDDASAHRAALRTTSAWSVDAHPGGHHAPGVTFFLTGSQVPGRPSMGAWLSYGLGSEAADCRLRRHDLFRPWKDLRATILRLLLGKRVPAEQVSGRAISCRWRPGSYLNKPDRGQSRGTAATSRSHYKT